MRACPTTTLKSLRTRRESCSTSRGEARGITTNGSTSVGQGRGRRGATASSCSVPTPKEMASLTPTSAGCGGLAGGAGMPPPSLGGGSDGAGYDIIAPATDYIDPSVAAFSASDIWVAMIRTTAPTDIVYFVRWNGATWSSPTAI